MYFIYFIKVAENIKIGICKATLKNLKQRLSEANRWCPNSEIMGLICTEDKDDEKKLHIYFKKHQIANEVFAYHKDIVKFIKKYCGWTTSKKCISHRWRSMISNVLKEEWAIVDKYRKESEKSKKITWQDWAKYHNSWYAINLKMKTLKNEGFIEISTHYDEYGSIDSQTVWLCDPSKPLGRGRYVQEINWLDYREELWYKKYENKFINISYSMGELSSEVKYISLRPDIEDDEDDFTGIDDDGFYYVDGEFCITDPLGIEAY